jgi:hypothetical protein
MTSFDLRVICEEIKVGLNRPLCGYSMNEAFYKKLILETKGTRTLNFLRDREVL